MKLLNFGEANLPENLTREDFFSFFNPLVQIAYRNKIEVVIFCNEQSAQKIQTILTSPIIGDNVFYEIPDTIKDKVIGFYAMGGVMYYLVSSNSDKINFIIL